MRIKYLGTAAAEGIPALYCQCDVCKKARILKGKNIQSRSEAMIDDSIMLDFGPDTFLNFVRFDIDSSKIHHVLITHSHEDHFYPLDFQYRCKDYDPKLEEEKLYIYGGEIVYKEVSDLINKFNLSDTVEAILFVPYQEYNIKDYKVFTLKANHSEYTSPLNYLISKGDKTLLYAHDTSIPEERYFTELKEHINKPLDYISLDITGGYQKKWYTHHCSLDTFLEFVSLLKDKHIIDSHTIIVGSHLSHNGGAIYDEFSLELEKRGMKLAYDGMEVIF